MTPQALPTVFATSFSWDAPLSQAQTLRIEAKLPASFLKENARYLRWQDRQNRLLARWLLMRQLTMLQALPATGLEEWNLNSYGKPFVASALPFSITHTEGLVAVAVSAIEIGIDVEHFTTEDNLDDFTSILAAEEKTFIEQSPSQNRAFTNLWTRKEAILKAGGWGLRDDLQHLCTLKNPTSFANRSWYWKALNLPQSCIGHVACYQPFLLQHEHLQGLI